MCDLGAAYIHGTTGNPLTALASEAGVDLKQVSESNPWIENSTSLALYSGGKRATAAEVAETDDAFYELVQRVTTKAQGCEDSFLRASGERQHAARRRRGISNFATAAAATFV